MKKGTVETEEPIHEHFGLSYAHYLVLPRSVLQSMSVEWQKQFVSLLKQMDDKIDDKYALPNGLDYYIELKGYDGKIYSITNDPLCEYERGRRNILKEK
jgi:hypothetical protein